MDAWEKFWMATLAVAVALATSAIVGSLVSDKTIQGYYLGAASHNLPVPCIYANAPWNIDQAVYCSDENERLLATLERLNATIVR